MGIGMIILFGVGVVAASNLPPDASAQVATNQYINTAWGIGVFVGVLVAYDVTGAHLNPAVTLMAYLGGGISARKGCYYVLAQLAGAFLGALVVTFDYVIFKGGDQLTNFYCTAPRDGYSAASWANCFYDELVGTAILILGILSIGETKGVAVHKFHVAGFVGILVFGIGNSFGVLSGYAINPARDLGPRLCFLLLQLWYGKGDIWAEVWGEGYFCIPIAAPLAGSFIATKFHRAVLSIAKENSK